MGTTENMIELLNKIRSENSELYKERIPEATRENLEKIQFAMTEGEDKAIVANAFMKSFLNKVAKTEIHDKFFKNPLAPLKKGTKPIGDSVEEVYSNFIKADTDAFNGENLFKRKLPDTKVIYHRKNYESQYTVTVSRKELKRAFSSYDNLEHYLRTVMNAAYNSLELDEFVNMKEIFKRAVDNNAIKIIKVPDPLASKENAEKFIEIVKGVSALMKYPKKDFNAYNDVQDVDKEELITMSRYDEQVLLLPELVNIKVDMSVLANSFNMTIADFNKTRKMLLDEFPIKGCVGGLIDEQFMQVHDDDLDVTEFFNPKSRYYNYYINNEQTMSYSVLVNAVLFVVGEDKEDANEDVDTFTVTKTLKDGVTLSNRRVNIIEGTEYSTKINGLAGGETVTVTMGGANVTADAYDAAAAKIEIESVSGNIEITVA